jgi:hypothetical protein
VYVYVHAAVQAAVEAANARQRLKLALDHLDQQQQQQQQQALVDSAAQSVAVLEE